MVSRVFLSFFFLAKSSDTLGFPCRYIYNLTTGGFAVTFPLERIVRNVSDSKLSNKGSDGTKINLNDAVYR